MGKVLELWKLTPSQVAPTGKCYKGLHSQDKTRMLIILQGCTDWSMPLLIALNALNEHHLLSELQIFISEYLDQTLDLFSHFIAAHACLNSE